MNPASSAAVPHAMPGRITRPVLVVAGMVLEADAVRGATGLDVRVAMGPAARDPDGRLAHLLPTVSGIVSFGTAGALDPTLRPGDCLLPSAVVDASGRQWATDAHWRAALATQWQCQGQSPVTCHQGLIAGSDTAVCSTADKAAWFSQTRASAVDMESHALAALAASYGLPFLVCRVVLDRADHDVPAAAMAGLTADGRTTVLPVIGALLREPGQLGALLRLGRDASTAQKTLKAIAAHLPPHFGLPDTALRR